MNASAETRNFPVFQLKSVLNPIEQATGLGNEFYTDDQYFKFERDRVLGQGWACIGFASDVGRNAYVKPIEFMGLPLLLMRNREGVLQVFHNVCSHRGMKLVQEHQRRRAVLGAVLHRPRLRRGRRAGSDLCKCR